MANSEWQRVWQLHLAGLSTRQIAYTLDLADRTVEDRLRRARHHYQGQDKSDWEEEIERRVSVYPDEDVRRWMEEQLRAWKGK